MEIIFEGNYKLKSQMYNETLDLLERYADVSEFGEHIVEAVVYRCDDIMQMVFAITENKRKIMIPYDEFTVQTPTRIKEYLGKPILVRILSKAEYSNNTNTNIEVYKASRKLLQQEYIDNVVKYWTPCTTVIQGYVTTVVGNNGMFLDCGYGLNTYVSKHTCTVAHIEGYTKTFSVGCRIPLVLLEPVREDNTIIVTHRELLGTWEDNAALFDVHENYLGVVTAVQPYGVFVALTANIVGLAEPSEHYKVGQVVSVAITRIDFDRQKIKLNINAVVPCNDLSVIVEHTNYFVASYLENVEKNKKWQYGKTAVDTKDTAFCYEQRPTDYPRVYISTVAGNKTTEKVYAGGKCSK